MGVIDKFRLIGKSLWLPDEKEELVCSNASNYMNGSILLVDDGWM